MARKGAIGAALGILGAGAGRIAESEQKTALAERLEASRARREEHLMGLRQKFQTEERVAGQKFQLEELTPVKAKAEIAVAQAKEGAKLDKTIYEAVDRDTRESVTARRVPAEKGGFKYVSQSGDRIFNEDEYQITPLRRVEVTGAPGEFGEPTKKVTGMAQSMLLKGEGITARLKEAIKKVKENPTSVGTAGAFREWASGVGGQMRDVGLPLISELGGAIKQMSDPMGKISDARALLAMVKSDLIPVILKDESRYSDQDMKRVDTVSKIDAKGADAEQVVEALETILDIHGSEQATYRKFLSGTTKWEDKALPKLLKGKIDVTDNNELFNALPSGTGYTYKMNGEVFEDVKP